MEITKIVQKIYSTTTNEEMEETRTYHNGTQYDFNVNRHTARNKSFENDC